MKSKTSRLSNEEFIKGKFTLSFLNGETPSFKIKKRTETRTLPVESYLDADLNNWEQAIDKETDYEKKLEVLHNARQNFSRIKLDYPIKKQVSPIMERLDEVEVYLKHWQNKPKQNLNVADVLYLMENEEEVFGSSRYQMFKATINNQGFIYFKGTTGEIKAVFYTAEIATILDDDKIAVWNTTSQKKEIINGRDFRKSFAFGYQKGIEIFNKKYPASPEIIYSNADTLIPDLLYHYYQYGYKGLKGWNYVKETYDTAFSHATIFDFGLYSGMVSRVDEMRTDYPLLFKKYEDAFEKSNSGNINPAPKQKGNKPQSLLDIWQGTQEQYNKLIAELKKDYIPIGMPFVKEKESKQVWVFKGRGWVQYLQALIWQCYKLGLLNDEIQLSAPQYQKILSYTFGLPAFDSKPFKSLLANQPKDKYLKAFRFLNSI